MLLLIPWHLDMYLVAVAAAAGSDGGGSIRVPSSWCGLVGLKPSAGRVGGSGAVEVDCTVATLGPMAGCVQVGAGECVCVCMCVCARLWQRLCFFVLVGSIRRWGFAGGSGKGKAASLKPTQ